jgi:hypothetical protein
MDGLDISDLGVDERPTRGSGLGIAERFLDLGPELLPSL